MKKTDLGVVGIIYAICFGFLYMILQLPKSTQIYPLFITGIIFALTSLYLAKMIIGYKKVGIISDSGEFEDFFAKQFFTIVSFIVIYLIMLNFLGFYISTVLFMLATLFYLKVPYLHAFITVAIVCLIVYLAFTKFLGVKLPELTLF